MAVNLDTFIARLREVMAGQVPSDQVHYVQEQKDDDNLPLIAVNISVDGEVIIQFLGSSALLQDAYELSCYARDIRTLITIRDTIKAFTWDEAVGLTITFTDIIPDETSDEFFTVATLLVNYNS